MSKYDDSTKYAYIFIETDIYWIRVLFKWYILEYTYNHDQEIFIIADQTSFVLVKK